MATFQQRYMLGYQKMIAAGYTPEEIANTPSGTVAQYEVGLQTDVEKVREYIESKKDRVTWTGPPTAVWAQRDMMEAVGKGLASKESLERYAKVGKKTFQSVTKGIAKDIAGAIPVAGEVVAALQIARGIPVVGDLVDGAVSTITEFASNPAALFDKASEIIKDIPVVGDILGTVEDVIGNIPVVGDIGKAVSSAVGSVGKAVTDVIGSIF